MINEKIFMLLLSIALLLGGFFLGFSTDDMRERYTAPCKDGKLGEIISHEITCQYDERTSWGKVWQITSIAMMLVSSLAFITIMAME